MSGARSQQQYQLRQQIRARQTAAPQMVGAPIKGLNTRDAFEAMDPQDAIVLDNFQPDYGGVRLREGSRVYQQLDTEPSSQDPNANAPITTLALWRSGSQEQLIGAQGGTVARVDGVQAILGTGLGSGWWNTVNFNHRLFWVNGSVEPQSYDGTTFGPAGFVADPSSTYTLDPANLTGVTVVHSRLFFWTGTDAGFWYGGVDYITGNLQYFPLDLIIPNGSSVCHIQPLTYDGGLGIATYTVIVCDSGDMLIYSGSDPSVPPTSQYPDGFALVGLYQVPPPIGPDPCRGYTVFGGDAYVITSSDYLKLSQIIMALRMGVQPPRSKACNAVKDAVAAAGTMPGWQMIYWGFGRRLLINVPQVDGTFRQHVYNTGLDAWSSYSNINAFCWCVWGDRLFFGAGDGYVVEFGIAGGDQKVLIRPPWNTTKWNSKPWQIERTDPIAAEGQQAWQLFGVPQTKRVAALRPIVRSQQSVSYEFGLAYDFDPVDYDIAVEHVGNPTPWNTTPWGSPWERPPTTDTVWYVAEGDGAAISIGIKSNTSTDSPLIWVRTDLRIEPGSML